jgi:hypothetical protein
VEVQRRLREAGLVEAAEVVDPPRLVPQRTPEPADRADYDLLARPLAQPDEAGLFHRTEERRSGIEDATRSSEGAQPHQRPEQANFPRRDRLDGLVGSLGLGRHPERMHLVRVVLRHHLVEQHPDAEP